MFLSENIFVDFKSSVDPLGNLIQPDMEQTFLVKKIQCSQTKAHFLL